MFLYLCILDIKSIKINTGDIIRNILDIPFSVNLNDALTTEKIRIKLINNRRILYLVFIFISYSLIESS